MIGQLPTHDRARPSSYQSIVSGPPFLFHFHFIFELISIVHFILHSINWKSLHIGKHNDWHWKWIQSTTSPPPWLAPALLLFGVQHCHYVAIGSTVTCMYFIMMVIPTGLVLVMHIFFSAYGMWWWSMMIYDDDDDAHKDNDVGNKDRHTLSSIEDGQCKFSLLVSTRLCYVIVCWTWL